jgi:HEAT repeat protein
MRAVIVTLDLREYAAAKTFLGQLLAANLDSTALADLVQEFGSAPFVRMMRTTELDPEGKQFAQAAMRAADATARDAARLQTLASQVSDSSASVQRTAIRKLQRAGSDAVAPLVRRLADDSQRDAHAAVRNALYHLGSPAIEPLMGVLESPDPNLRRQAIEVLGRLRAKVAMASLVGALANPQEDPEVRSAAGNALEMMTGLRPHPADARDFLALRINELLDGEFPRTPDVDGMIELWRWDEAQAASAPQRYPANQAGAVLAARLAVDLYEFDPAREDHRRLYLESQLHAAKITAGLHLPLPRGAGTAHADAAAMGAQVVEDALQHAMDSGRIPAAIGATEVLGDIGASALAHSGTACPAPLVAALSHKNQRLRMAAAEAISKIDPKSPYPNSFRYIETLARLARTEATPRVLVADPRSDVSQTLAGMLIGMGFEADAAYTGRQAYDMAGRRPDYAFVLLSDALNDPPVGQVVELLRQDLRTADLPIGVMYRIDIEPIRYTSETDELIDEATKTGDRVPGLFYKEDRLIAARRIAGSDRLTAVFPMIYDAASLDYAMRRLLAIADGDFVTPQEHLYYAQVALDALARYADDPVMYRFYEPARVQLSIAKALDEPELAPLAAKALGRLGSAAAQRALVDVASHIGRPIDVRQAAALAFRQAVIREHLQLTTKEILLQYERYNQSASLDRQTQLVLGHVLDTLEGVREEPPPSHPADVEDPNPAS